MQTPYGDSGKTTFFIRGERDWDKNAGDMAGQELKVMKRINNRAAAVEAVLTRHGTIVGPLMTDLTGHPELTPHKGGWCGNDIFPEALSPEHRERARVLTQKLGDRLAVEGYRGFMEIDYLADVDTGELYLGEINPRISGVTSMTNVTAAAYADVPLFLFHLLEYLDVDYEVDVEDINRRWAEASSVDVWSQIILKQNREGVELLTAGAEDRHLAARGLRPHRVRPLGQRLAQPAGRDRGVLPARAGAGRLPLPGRRPRRAGGALADADRGEQADRARARVDRGIHAQFAGTAVAHRRAPGAERRDGVQDRVTRRRAAAREGRGVPRLARSGRATAPT